MKLSTARVALVALLLVFLAVTAPAFAQDAADAPASVEVQVENPFNKGTQTIGISAGVHIPLFVFGGNATSTEDNLSTGGLFGFQYQNFIAPGLAIGGSISGAFNGTIGGGSLFVAPLTFRTAYWWSLLPFELCVAAEAGGYLMRYDNHGMVGPFAKAGGGAYWRSSPSWSLGLQTYYWLVPEIHTGDYADLTRFGNFLEVGLSAVYHL